MSVGRCCPLRPRRLGLGAGVVRGAGGQVRSRVWVAHAAAPSRGGCGLRGGRARVLCAPGPAGGVRRGERRPGPGRSGGTGKGASNRCADTSDPGWVSCIRRRRAAAGERLLGPSFIPFQVLPPSVLQPLSLFWPHALIAFVRNSGVPFYPLPCWFPSLGLRIRLPRLGSF